MESKGMPYNEKTYQFSHNKDLGNISEEMAKRNLHENPNVIFVPTYLPPPGFTSHPVRPQLGGQTGGEPVGSGFVQPMVSQSYQPGGQGYGGHQGGQSLANKQTPECLAGLG